MVFQVLITDEHSNGYEYNETYFNGIDAWAQEHCASYIGFTVVDVADVSGSGWDEIAEYEFRSEQDALLFTLKWK
jgi:hypothetical protein